MTTPYESIWPNKFYEDIAGVCTITDVFLAATGATNNQLVVAAVSGKVIMVISGNLKSNGVSSSVVFKSASAGTNKWCCLVPANTVATPNVLLPYCPVGVFRTNVGEGLYMDNAGADSVSTSLTYITYTP